MSAIDTFFKGVKHGFPVAWNNLEGNQALSELIAIRARIAEASELAFAIQREVGSDPNNRWCRNAAIIATQLSAALRGEKKEG